MELREISSYNVLSNEYKKEIKRKINQPGYEKEAACSVYMSSDHENNKLIIIDKGKIITIEGN